MSDSFIRCQCAKIGGKIKEDCSDTSVSGKTFANLGCMRFTAHWTDLHPVAEFWFIWSDKLGFPEYQTVYITLGCLMRYLTQFAAPLIVPIALAVAAPMSELNSVGLQAAVENFLYSYLAFSAPHWIWLAVSGVFEASDNSTVGGLFGLNSLLACVTLRGCKKFCVNGQMAGNCRLSRKKRNDRNERTDRPPAGELQKA